MTGWGGNVTRKRLQRDWNMSGEEVAYKQIRVTGSKANISNLPQSPKNDFISDSDGQHGGSDLPEENRRYEKQKTDKNSKTNLGTFDFKWDFNYSETFSSCLKEICRSGISQEVGQFRMNAEQKCLRKTNFEVKEPINRSICTSSVSSTVQICGLESQAIQHSDRCAVGTMEPERLLCFPNNLSDLKKKI